MKKWMGLVVAMALSLAVVGSEAESRHAGHAGGTVGPNGIKQQVALQISKVTQTKSSDKLIVILDLGTHKYESTKPQAFINPTPTVESGIKYRPVLLLTVGNMPVLTAQSDLKGKITGDFQAKLINKGAGIKITISKRALPELLSQLMGFTAENPAKVKFVLQDNHLPAPVASAEAGSRHGTSLVDIEFDVEVKEDAKKLVGKH